MAYRKLHINNDVWEYCVGAVGVKIKGTKKASNCKVSDWIQKYKLFGMTEEEFNQKRHDFYVDCDFDHTFSLAVGPADVKNHILKNYYKI